MKKFRPFGALKLIRDNKTNVRNFGFWSTRENHRYRHFINGLQNLEFINVSDDGEIVPTDKLQIFIDALDLSLTQLENYSPDSMVLSPVFGLPSNEF